MVSGSGILLGANSSLTPACQWSQELKKVTRRWCNKLFSSTPLLSYSSSISPPSAMGRRKNGKRRGPPTWAKGTQLAFLEKRKSAWTDAGSVQRGKFYTNCTWLFIKKYGWDLKDNDDDDPDEDKIVDIRKELVEEGDEETQEEHTVAYKKLRQVGVILLPHYQY
jgi:hypothetical protein